MCPEVTVALTVGELDRRILVEHHAARDAELAGRLLLARQHRANTDRMLDLRPRLVEYEGGPVEVPC